MLGCFDKRGVAKGAFEFEAEVKSAVDSCYGWVFEELGSVAGYYIVMRNDLLKSVAEKNYCMELFEIH